jgi:hypothetical protein
VFVTISWQELGDDKWGWAVSPKKKKKKNKRKEKDEEKDAAGLDVAHAQTFRPLRPCMRVGWLGLFLDDRPAFFFIFCRN